MIRTWGSALAVGLALALSPANAADLGGNCCADLEERVAELEATTARKGNKKVSLTVYGQVNAGILWTDNSWDLGAYVNDTKVPIAKGSSSSKNVFDNNVSESRFGFRGEAKITEAVKAGFLMEIGVGEPTGDREITVRHAAWYLDSAAGRLTVGKTSQATDDIDTMFVANLGAAVKMLSVAPAQPSDVSLDGDGPWDGKKANIVRYDTPTFVGFMASASWADEDTWDAALRYAGEFSGFKVAAGVGYRQQAAIGSDFSDAIATLLDEKKVKTWLATAGVMHAPSGVFIQGAYGDLDGGFIMIPAIAALGVSDVSANIKGWHVIGGLEQKFFPIGKTTLFGEYANADAKYALSADTLCGVPCGVTYPTETTFWGLGVVQAIDAAAMDLYATFRQHDVDGSLNVYATPDSVGLEGSADTKVFQAGARIKF